MSAAYTNAICASIARPGMPRSAVPLDLNGLARQKNRDRPSRFILNYSNATATNVYLLLYPKPVLARWLRGDPDLAVRVWQALDRISQKDRIHEGRVYGGGLYKLEPKEVSKVRAAGIWTLVFEGAGDTPEAMRYEQLPLLVPRDSPKRLHQTRGQQHGRQVFSDMGI